jgi:hypothetical protein
MNTPHTDEKKPPEAGVVTVSCQLTQSNDGRFYVEAVTSDGQRALCRILQSGASVTLSIEQGGAIATGFSVATQ